MKTRVLVVVAALMGLAVVGTAQTPKMAPKKPMMSKKAPTKGKTAMAKKGTMKKGAMAKKGAMKKGTMKAAPKKKG